MVIHSSIFVLLNNNKNVLFVFYTLLLCLLMTISPSILGLLNNNKDKNDINDSACVCCRNQLF